VQEPEAVPEHSLDVDTIGLERRVSRAQDLGAGADDQHGAGLADAPEGGGGAYLVGDDNRQAGDGQTILDERNQARGSCPC
jgi:hypothetical protein